MEISMLESDWLGPYHPIPNSKFPPITTLENRSTYHGNSKDTPAPCSQIQWAPQINEKTYSKRASNNVALLFLQIEFKYSLIDDH